MIPSILSAVTDGEGYALRDLADGRVVLECGSHFGFSTVIMATVAERVVAVDWHYGDAHSGPGNDSLGPYFENLERYEVRHKVVTVVGRFEDVLPMLKPNSFDAAFIDGFHEYEAVKRDTLLVLPLLKSEGFLAFHDYGPEHFGVKRAVDDLFPGGLNGRVQNLAWVQV